VGRKFTIETVFTAIDQITKPIDKIQGKVSKFSKSGSQSFASVGKTLLKVTALVGGLSFATAQLSDTIKVGKEFQQTMTNASAKFSDAVDENGKIIPAVFDKLSKSARDVGGATEFAASEAGAGLDFLAMAGFTAEQAIAALPGVVDLATASSTDLATATDIASDSLGAFGLMTDDSIELTKNLARVSDVMAKTTTATNTDMVTLFETMKKGGPAFTSAGQEIETFSALAGRMAANSIKGSDAGTALRSGILRLAAPTKQVSDALNGLGIQVKGSDGNMRNMIDIVDDMSKATANMDNVQRSAALGTIFGKNAFSAWATVINEGVDNSRALEETLKNAGGASAAMAKNMRNTLEGRVKTLSSSIESLKLSLFDALIPVLTPLTEKMTEVVRVIDTWIQKNKELITGTLSRVGQTLMFIVKLLTSDVAKAVGVAVIAFMALQKLLVIITIVRQFMLFIKVLRAAAAAQGILNAVMAMNPIGLIIIGIAALIGIIVLLVLKWDVVKEVFWKTIDFLKKKFWEFVDVIKEVWAKISELLDNPFFAAAGLLFAPFITIPALIIKHWTPIKKLFLDIWDVIKKVSGGITNFGGKVGKFFGFGKDKSKPIVDNTTPTAPLSPNSAVIENRNLDEKRSTVDVNFNNTPKGTDVVQTGGSPGMNMNLGFAK
jgi:TP901 family phage tail tape measure protein